MQLVSFTEPVSITVKRSTGSFNVHFQAHQPYVLSNSHFKNLYDGVKHLLYKVSTYDWRIENFNIGSVQKGEKILYFNGSGGFGDQILSWPVANILHKLGLEVHVLTELGLDLCWWNFPWVKSTVPSPISQGHLEMWRHKAFMESVVNFDEHPDQLHPVDTQLKKFGIDPNTIDPELKSVKPIFTPGEKEAAEGIRGGVKKLGIYQLASTSPTRSMSHEASLTLLTSLSNRFKDVAWIAIYDCFVSEDLVKRANSLNLPNVRTMTFSSLRVLWATTAMADVCVGPDSMMVHIAGSLGTPMVGLWGPMNPESRVKYYKNHIPIWNQNACQFSPCFISTHSFPSFCPPSIGPRTTCAVIGSIQRDDVCNAVSRLLS